MTDDEEAAPAPRFDLLLAHADSVFCVIRRTPTPGELLFVSDSARRVLGAAPAELVGCARPPRRGGGCAGGSI